MHGGYSRQDGKAGPAFQAAGLKRSSIPAKCKRTNIPAGWIDEAVYSWQFRGQGWFSQEDSMRGQYSLQDGIPSKSESQAFKYSQQD